MKKLILSLVLALTSLFAMAQKGTFEAGKGTFLLNGKPFIVKAAEVHYPRIPRPYWEHRIQMCKALGMNAVCTQPHVCTSPCLLLPEILGSSFGPTW